MSMRALDLCTGSGCVAITLARERPTSHVHATDVSDDALAVARDNALRLGAYNVALREGDLFAAVDPACRFDLVTANPPYIADGARSTSLQPDVRDYEPRLALDGGADGLALVRRIVAEAPARLPRARAASLARRGRRRRGSRPSADALRRARASTRSRCRRDYGAHRAGGERRAKHLVIVRRARTRSSSSSRSSATLRRPLASSTRGRRARSPGCGRRRRAVALALVVLVVGRSSSPTTMVVLTCTTCGGAGPRRARRRSDDARPRGAVPIGLLHAARWVARSCARRRKPRRRSPPGDAAPAAA